MPSRPPALGPCDLLAVVPAYNEASRIAPVVAGLIEQGLPVLVVDDGSRDHTAQAARRAGA
ncbi:MAG: glycosyltransferase, partial [Planctomycetes bacterium]|nr:glycosyltransferase [Planctomycetota bacterium]